jgi:hypothetical protein
VVEDAVQEPAVIVFIAGHMVVVQIRAPHLRAPPMAVCAARFVC